MLLAIDIGNTNANLGLFLRGQWHAHDVIPMQIDQGEPSYERQLETFFSRHCDGDLPRTALIGSVVAGTAELFAGYCRQLQVTPHIVDGTWDLGLKVDCDNPDHVGIDRLLSAAAAFARTPQNHSAVVADAGTAITVDAVSAQGVFVGGTIAPGLHLMLGALHRGTSLLPAIDWDGTPPLPGKNTGDAMRAGVLYGGAALVEGLCRKISQTLPTPAISYLTGGDAQLLAKWTHGFDCCDPDLVLSGLILAHERRLLTM